MKAVCMIYYEERLFLREWVDYHLGIGFDRIYLFEDATNTSSHADLVADLISDGRVVLRRFNGCNIPRTCSFRQLDLYNWFLNEYGDSEISWCAFIDSDEFVTLKDGITLDELTGRFEDCTGFALHWKVYGASGHVKRPDLPVREDYTKDTGFWWDYKSFVNMKKAKAFWNVHYIEGAVGMDFLPSSIEGNGWCTPPVAPLAHINHYLTKSWEDFVDRMRTQTFFNFRTFDTFFYVNPDMKPMARELIASTEGMEFKNTNCLSYEFGIYTGKSRTVLAELNRKTNG